MKPVHVAITRRVKPGREAEFEAALLEFIAQTMSVPGVLGAQLLRPAPDDPVQEYGIMRTFASEEARDTFYERPEFFAWEEQVAPLVDGPYHRRELHGLEAFFRAGSLRPPKWKMAVLTWVGVYPSAFVWNHTLGPLLRPLPGFLVAAIISAFVVVTLAWLVMPLLSRVFESWLLGKGRKS